MSDDLLERCFELREEEITVIESIYPENLKVHPSSSDRPGTLCTLTIPIALPSETTVVLAPSPPMPQPGTQALPHEHCDTTTVSSSSSSATATLALSHLPALSLRIVLPETYPIAAPPRPLGLRAPLSGPGVGGEVTVGSGWLSRRVQRSITDKLGQMWAEDREAAGGSDGEGAGVLWRWCEWVGTGEFLEELGITMEDGRLRIAVPPSLPTAAFHTALKTYNAQQLHSSFESTAFSCTICFESRKGKRCVQMPFGCVFCHDCLAACWTLAITEGTLESVSCPDPACVKRRATALGPRAGVGDLPEGQAGSMEEEGVGAVAELEPALVESVVGVELRERWQDLKSRRRAEIDPTYSICPREQCQAPVPPPPLPSTADLASAALISSRAIRLSDLSSSSASTSTSNSTSASTARTTPTPAAPAPAPAIATEDRWARYRQCPTCLFSFCLYCASTWHGPHTPCAFPQTASIVREYLSYPADSPERARIEARRGRRNIERMVREAQEDAENKAWLEQRTRGCAGCGVRVEKSHGCNHMTCGRCGAHFCYRCGGSIKPSDPYAHYRTPGTSCFEKLFDQEEIARFERETAMDHAGMGFGFDMDQALVGDEWGPRGVWEW